MRRGRRLLGIVLGTMVGLLLAEGTARVAGSAFGLDRDRLARFQRIVWTRGGWLFEPRAYYGFVRPPAKNGVNALGFHDVDHAVVRREGIDRIACLGGSTTEGGGPGGPASRFPEILDRVLERHLGRPVEVMNWGMSSWTSAEVLVNYFLNVQDFDPDVVVLHLGANDVAPRLWPGFRRDYTHYRRAWVEPSHGFVYRLLVRSSALFAALQLRTSRRVTVNDFVDHPIPRDQVPTGPEGLPEETTEPFRRNVDSIVSHVLSRGRRVVLATIPYREATLPGDPPIWELHRIGIDQHNEVLRGLARDRSVPMVDLAAWSRRQPDRFQPHFRDLVHLDRQGNYQKAFAIAGAVVPMLQTKGSEADERSRGE